jgi:hypothetical protein
VNLSPEKTNYWISDDAAAASDLGALDVGPRLTDAILGESAHRVESAPPRRASGLTPSSLTRLSLLAVAGCLLGAAWLAGSASLHRAATQQVSGQLAETGQATGSAVEAPTAALGAINAAQSLRTVDTAPVGSAKPRLATTKAESSSATAEASGDASPSG